jgi:hypothetical protein
MFIHILPNIGGSLLGALEKTVVDSGYYLADGTDGNESYVIGLWNSFTDDIPVEKRISIATPDMTITQGSKNTFLSSSLKSVNKIRGKSCSLSAFLTKQKRSIPVAVAC